MTSTCANNRKRAEGWSPWQIGLGSRKIEWQRINEKMMCGQMEAVKNRGSEERVQEVRAWELGTGKGLRGIWLRQKSEETCKEKA